MHDQHPTASTGPVEEPAASVGYERPPMPEPRIYVASLSDYNNGVLHGRWLDAAREPEDIFTDIDAILASSRQPDAEEFAIHDYEGFGNYAVHEYTSIEHVARIARGIAEHGQAFAAWADLHDSDPDQLDGFEAAYLGHYESAETYAYQLADDAGFHTELARLPESLQPYVSIDYAAMARDLGANGDVATCLDPRGGAWLFDGHS